MKRIGWMGLLAMVGCLVFGNVQAAEWNFYGSARIQTFVWDDDYGDSDYPDDAYFVQYLQSNARIGARVTVNEHLTGRFEYDTGVNVRILYGEWDFGAGRLLVGQTYTPLNMFYSNQVWWDDTNLMDFGGVYSRRHPMIRLAFGSFQVALIEPSNPSWFLPDSTTETKIPKIEAKYRYSQDHWHLQVAGGYNTYDLLKNGSTYDIDAYVVALGGGVTFGKAYVQGSVWVGQNAGGYRMFNQSVDVPYIDTVTNELHDNDAHACALVAGYKVNDTVSLEAGYGYTEGELDHPTAHENGITTYYLQAALTLAPGVSVTPEIGYVDWGEGVSGQDYGETRYYGAKWQIDF